ncbi:MAG TPA: MBL fold metallo-hydrolase [Thermoanaerobaculia bacterium]|jgi:glyoxylase-like metal-dependent hydrolase (beta-lactamase superfamily II)
MKRLALLLLLALPAAAQVSDETARMEKVAEGVYAIVHDDATDAWPHSNTGVIVGDDGVLVVDSTYLPSRARADIALIRKVTDKPVKYLVITHWHFDHNNGNSVYRDAFPGIAIVSDRNTRDFIDVNSTWWPKMSTAPDSDRRKDLEKKAAEGLDPKIVAKRRSELEELAKLEVVPPNMVFDRTLTLHLGKRRIELRDMGKANSPDDTIVWLPEEKILFTGDIVVQSPLPYLGASWPVSWVKVLRELEAMPVAAIVPGHGPVMRDHSYVRRVRDLIEDTLAKTEALIRQGKTLVQIQSTIDLSAHRRAFAPWMTEDEATWKQITDVLVERAWRGVRGQG